MIRDSLAWMWQEAKVQCPTSPTSPAHPIPGGTDLAGLGKTKKQISPAVWHGLAVANNLQTASTGPYKTPHRCLNTGEQWGIAAQGGTGGFLAGGGSRAAEV